MRVTGAFSVRSLQLSSTHEGLHRGAGRATFGHRGCVYARPWLARGPYIKAESWHPPIVATAATEPQSHSSHRATAATATQPQQHRTTAATAALC